MLPHAMLAMRPTATFIASVPIASSRTSPFTAAICTTTPKPSHAPLPHRSRPHPHTPPTSPNPTMQLRGKDPPPAPVQERILSILPYLLPLLDSLSFGKVFFSKAPLLAQILLPPLLPLYSLYRGIPLLAFGVFLALYLLVVRNPNISRYVRFNTYQALIIDIALIFPQLFQGINLNIPSTIAETCSTAVFYAVALAIIYAVVRNAQGQVPDEIPAISESVYQQLGPF